MIQSSMPGLCMSFNLVKNLKPTTIVATVSSEQMTARSIGALFRSPSGGGVVGEVIFTKSQRLSRVQRDSHLKRSNVKKDVKPQNLPMFFMISHGKLSSKRIEV